MQPATAGKSVARVSPGGRPPMNAMLAFYLLAMLMGFIVIVILENNDDGGAA